MIIHTPPQVEHVTKLGNNMYFYTGPGGQDSPPPLQSDDEVPVPTYLHSMSLKNIIDYRDRPAELELTESGTIGYWIGLGLGINSYGISLKLAIVKSNYLCLVSGAV
jgi:hypothetical protein